MGPGGMWLKFFDQYVEVLSVHLFFSCFLKSSKLLSNPPFWRKDCFPYFTFLTIRGFSLKMEKND